RGRRRPGPQPVRRRREVRPPVAELLDARARPAAAVPRRQRRLLPVQPARPGPLLPAGGLSGPAQFRPGPAGLGPPAGRRGAGGGGRVAGGRGVAAGKPLRAARPAGPPHRPPGGPAAAAPGMNRGRTPPGATMTNLTESEYRYGWREAGPTCSQAYLAGPVI